MSDDSPQPAPRKPRADGQRNRERILQVAKEAFTRHGAHTSLDDIARQAGVGPGTLYRHFPTRQAMLEAVYSVEVEKLAAAERDFSATMPPIEALRAWLILSIDYIATKQIIVPALTSLVSTPPEVLQCSGNLILNAIQSLVGRAVASGDIRPDLDPVDLLRVLFGLSTTAPAPDWPQSARRMIDILLLGSRPTA